MRFKTWPVAAIGLGSLLLLIVVSMLTLSRKAQEIYSQLDHLNTYHHNMDAKLRSLRSDVNLSGIFVRDYLLDVARDHAPEYRDRLAEFRQKECRNSRRTSRLDAAHWERIANLETQLDELLADVRAAVRLDKQRKDLSKRELSPTGSGAAKRGDSRHRAGDRGVEQRQSRIAACRGHAPAGRRLAPTSAGCCGRHCCSASWWPSSPCRGSAAGEAVRRARALAEDAERQMRLLSQQLVATQEDERKNLSRELHDHVAQVLTALRMELGRIERAIPPRVCAPMEEASPNADSSSISCSEPSATSR